MHFLCLHGVGTNSKILELQTAAIRYGLGPEHTYDFVEGGVDYPMEAGIAHLVSARDSFHAYFDPSSGRAMISALGDLAQLIADADPPYDGILGFSQGASLAATFLLGPDPMAKTCFKVAIFLSAGMAADHAVLHLDRVQMLEAKAKAGQCNIGIQIPTAHVFAENDPVAPAQGRLLHALCAPTVAHVAVHNLGHRVPGAGERDDLQRAITVIRQAIADAERR
ncbi:serine hydrolase FSH [Aspergillus falconensis]